jgi:hypothetical protein
MHLAAFTGRIATQCEDLATVTPSHRYLSVSLVIGCPSLVVDGVGAAWPVALLGEGDECEVETGCDCGHGGLRSRASL